MFFFSHVYSSVDVYQIYLHVHESAGIISQLMSVEKKNHQSMTYITFIAMNLKVHPCYIYNISLVLSHIEFIDKFFPLVLNSIITFTMSNRLQFGSLPPIL